MKKICIITTTRADYGLFFPLISAVKKEKDFKLQILASGTHFSKDQGETYKEIENDGFEIDFKGYIDLSSSSHLDVASNVSKYSQVFTEGLSTLKPDVVIVLGDRYEILTAAQIAVLLKIQVVHLYGGDVTMGANDDLFRNAISKLSSIHFVSNQISLNNLIKMGVNPKTIHNVGSLANENILNTKKEKDFFKKIGFRPCNKNILVTFHPVTQTKFQSSLVQLEELLKAILPEWGVIFTASNTDAEGEALNKRIQEYCKNNPNAKFYQSLGREGYINAVRNIDVVVGNSSSGIYEVPALKKPSVNIGDRQEGRLLSNSIIAVKPEASLILKAILKAFNIKASKIKSVYGGKNASSKIVKALK